MYCRHCGRQEGLEGAAPQLNHATWLCQECEKLSSVGYHYHPATGAPHDFGDLPFGERLRKLIHDEVQQALHPPPAEGLVNVREYRRVEQREPDGSLWRGMLYRVEEHAV